MSEAGCSQLVIVEELAGVDPALDVDCSDTIVEIDTGSDFFDIYLPGPPGPPGPPGSSPPELELHLFWELAHPSHYLKYLYSAGALTEIRMYTDNTLATLIMKKEFTYSGSDLSQIKITRLSDGAIETRTFAYSGGSLDNVNVAQT